MTASFELLSLPPEIVFDSFAKQLCTDDLFNFASTCTLMRSECFRPELFYEIAFSRSFITTEAIIKLIQVLRAKNLELLSAVRSFDFSGFRFSGVRSFDFSSFRSHDSQESQAFEQILRYLPNLHTLDLRTFLTQGLSAHGFFESGCSLLASTGFRHASLAKIYLYHPAADHLPTSYISTLLTSFRSIVPHERFLSFDVTKCTGCNFNYTSATAPCSFCPAPALVCRPCRGEQPPTRALTAPLSTRFIYSHRRRPVTVAATAATDSESPVLRTGACSYCRRAACLRCRPEILDTYHCVRPCGATFSICASCRPVDCKACGRWNGRCVSCREDFVGIDMRQCQGCELWFCKMGKEENKCTGWDGQDGGWWACQKCGGGYCGVCWEVMGCEGCQGKRICCCEGHKEMDG